MHHRLDARADRPESSQAQQVESCGSQRGHCSGAIAPIAVGILLERVSRVGYGLDQDPLVYVSCYGALAYTASLLKFPGTGFELLANNVATLHQDAVLEERNAILACHSVASPQLSLDAPQDAYRPEMSSQH
ncbi:MAG: hypothetical protein ACKOZW_10090 [Cyanobium sp.]